MVLQKHFHTISLMEYGTSSFNASRFARALFFLFLFFFFLVIFQVSFLAHFAFFGFVPHIVLFAYLVIHILEKPVSGLGLLSALVGGILLDMYASKPFGFYTALFAAGSLTITIFKAHYVRFPQF